MEDDFQESYEKLKEDLAHTDEQLYHTRGELRDLRMAFSMLLHRCNHVDSMVVDLEPVYDEAMVILGYRSMVPRRNVLHSMEEEEGEVQADLAADMLAEDLPPPYTGTPIRIPEGDDVWHNRVDFDLSSHTLIPIEDEIVPL